ncbi:hypothetical protein HU200_057691 [Digitaria exilis]|uniref:non-specific serine/threonine protein kinase n=1 Tax=Digitaria exilis TaxID=1010633 RepID=A0A835AAE5_9POAL|nr:hypothetical protein HU200_057691 [Digitaria exilis]
MKVEPNRRSDAASITTSNQKGRSEEYTITEDLDASTRDPTRGKGNGAEGAGPARSPPGRRAREQKAERAEEKRPTWPLSPAAELAPFLKYLKSQIMDATMYSSHLLLLLSSMLVLSPTAFAAGVGDTLGTGRNITDNETLVSADGTFTLGFFSPSSSTKTYLGVWFTVSGDAICWVANGDRPINGNSGVLVISNTGSLLLLDSGAASPASSAEAQLLNNGDLVVRDHGSSAILWQSFDHPSNTLLSGMKLGKTMWTGTECYLTSWRSADDASPGAYSRKLDTSG